MDDPPPPSQPPGNPPLPPAGGDGLGRPPSGRTGAYPPVAAGLIRSSSSGSLQAGGAPLAPGDGGLVRSSSSGSLRNERRPPSAGGFGARNPSRDQLEPLPGSPQVGPAPTDTWATPRDRGVPRLAPLPVGGTPGADRPLTGGSGGGGSGRGPRSVRSEKDPGTPKVVSPPAIFTKEDLGLNAQPPVPVPSLDAGAARRAKAQTGVDPDATTARGPVKWVPHTHSNPKHAKFCFICLHGKLEGDRDGIDEDLKRQSAEDEDLPSPVDMKELGYLLSIPPGQGASEGRFRRAGADYERNNISALWLREVTGRVYDETIKGMVVQQNVDIAAGVDVKLVDEREDEVDRQALSRLFTMSEEEKYKLQKDLENLGKWCESLEPKLLDVMPTARVLGSLPEVDPPTERQMELLAYQPLVDPSRFKGESALDARMAASAADAMLSSKSTTFKKPKEHSGAPLAFQVHDLPVPLTYPDMAEMEVIPYPLTVQDVPPYLPMRPQKPTRQPVDSLTDPFQRPFLYHADFHETIMPTFEGTSGFGQPRSAKPVACDEKWVSKTRSIFPDNNEEDEKWGWGMVPARKRVMPLLIDEPYLPPFDLIGTAGGMKMMLRGIWDPELFCKGGTMVPPLGLRGKGLYVAIPVEHPDEPLWSRALAPPQSREQKILELIPIMTVRSYTKFRPKKVLVDMPDFLWDLVREDAAGQGLWDVIRQRHEIPREEKEEAERRAQKMHEEKDEERQAILQTMQAEQAAISASVGFTGGGSDSPRSPMSPSRASQTGAASRPETREAEAAPDTRAILVEETAGMPRMEVEPPRTPQASAALPQPEGQNPSAEGGGGAATDSTGPAVRHFSTDSVASEVRLATPQARQRPSPVSAGLPGSPTNQGFPASPSRRTSLQEHQMRVTGLVQQGSEGRKVEELLADDRFLDTLADKITHRLTGVGSGLGDTMAGTQASFGGGQSKSQVMGSSLSMAGKPTVMRPDHPSFAEPTDKQSKAQLPRALQAGGGVLLSAAGGAAGKGGPADPTEATMTTTDVNSFTQEKMRGECYVRLLIHPDENAARKAIVPYQGEPLQPDISLVMGGNRPFLMVPPKPPVLNEDGEMVEDDEFADFEKHDNVAFSFVRHNRYEAVEALIQQEHDVLTAKDESGNNLLHVACQNDHRRIAKLLLKNGIQVNDQNNRGNTALHYCFQYGFMQLSDYLISHGADETLANNAGLMPAQGTGVEDPVGVAQKNLQSGD